MWRSANKIARDGLRIHYILCGQPRLLAHCTPGISHEISSRSRLSFLTIYQDDIAGSTLDRLFGYLLASQSPDSTRESHSNSYHGSTFRDLTKPIVRGTT